MICEYIYGYPFYFFEAPDLLTEQVYKDIQNITFEDVFADDTNNRLPSLAGSIDVEGKKTCYYNKELYDFLDTCLSPIYKKTFISAKHHVINDIWPTKALFGQQSDWHFHQYSVFSGLLYLHDSKTSTLFRFEDQLEKVWGRLVAVNLMTTELIYESKAIKGKVIIFPSILKHKIPVHREKKSRFTIAFNSFWSGKVSDILTGCLELNTTSAKDWKS